MREQQQANPRLLGPATGGLAARSFQGEWSLEALHTVLCYSEGTKKKTALSALGRMHASQHSNPEATQLQLRLCVS